MFYNICLLVLGSVPISIFIYFKWKYQYWSKRKVPYLEPHFPFGNFVNPFDKQKAKNFGVEIGELYSKIKSNGWKFGGVYFFANPVFIPADLQLLKKIMNTDFQYFTDRDNYVNEDDPITCHLLNMSNNKWQTTRPKFLPMFSPRKIKMMFPALTTCMVKLQNQIKQEALKKQPIDIKDFMACYSVDAVSTYMFGLDMDTMEKKNCEFLRVGKKISHISTKRIIISMLSGKLMNLAKLLGLSYVPAEISNFFFNLVEDVVKYRDENKIVRKDFFQFLIDLKDCKFLTLNEMAAHCYGLIAAQFDTIPTGITFALYELAKNHTIQDKVRSDILSVLSNASGEITYDCIHEMTYLDQVIAETLRRYPPGTATTRKCVQDYKISTPEGNIILERGTRIIIPIYALHSDETFYPNPAIFDPNRFSSENKRFIPNFAYIPFGEGPRTCIAIRLSLVQIKLSLIALVRDFKWTVSYKTKEPLKIAPSNFFLRADGDIWLNAEPIN